MAKSMEDRLRDLKEEKEGEALPKEQEIKIETEKVEDGTQIVIDEEQNIKPEHAEKARPKPVPKRERRGSKQLLAEVEEAKALAESNKDKYTRLLAEFDNMRSRNEKENAEMHDVGAKDTLKKLLPVVDNFERALESVTEDEKNGFEQGIEMIYKQLMETLEQMGARPMNCVGQEFDPTYHNAAIHVEDDSYEENVIVEEMQKGYMFKDSVLRHAVVKVAN